LAGGELGATIGNLVTQAEFARAMGVSRMAVTKWKAEGKVVFRDRLVDVAATKERLDRYRVGGSEPRKSADTEPVNRPVNRAPEVYDEDDDDDAVNSADADALAAEILRTTGTEWTLDEAKRIKESFKALRERLAYDIESHAVVVVSEVAASVGREFATVRTAFLSLAAEHAEPIARLRTPAEVRDYLETAITKILRALVSDRDPDAPAA
jgi:transcriptional regulator with XRE-family HTH domain